MSCKLHIVSKNRFFCSKSINYYYFCNLKTNKNYSTFFYLSGVRDLLCSLHRNFFSHPLWLYPFCCNKTKTNYNMKHKGCYIDFIDQRNKELMQAFRSAIMKPHNKDLNIIFAEVVNTPCSRFWVSEERAMAVVSALDSGQDILDSMRPLKKEMFTEIYKRVRRMRSSHKKMSTFDIVFEVVNSEAPKFYLRERCAMDIYYKIKSGFYENRISHYKSPRP